MEFETLETEQQGPVLRVWLARPAKLNAIDATVLREVGDLFRRLETDFETRVVVLGGRGRSFCAGFDRKPAPHRGPAPGDREQRYIGQLGRRACRAIEECEAITVARVHGHALGGGCCFALSCDFRIATDDARFRLPEIELGLPLSWAAVPRLIQEIGTARAREMLMLCEDVSGERALRLGLAHAIVSAERLDEEVDAWVGKLLAKPDLALAMTKTQLRGYSRLFALGDASEADADMITVAQRSEAFRERWRKG
jgi:enoyl-CoA hydratase/carnithine racemase